MDPAPPNALGLRRVMFAVDDIDDIDDIDDTVARLRDHGGELLGAIEQYENVFLLCCVRGPGGIIVALAEETGG
jgi:predicted enzyme related to lactoylglutathione lyase